MSHTHSFCFVIHDVPTKNDETCEDLIGVKKIKSYIVKNSRNFTFMTFMANVW